MFQKLHLRRPDIEFNSLDRLDTFLGSDLGQDPLLRGLLANSPATYGGRIVDAQGPCRSGVRNANPEFLLEFRMGPDRLGYLVAHLLADKLILRTFLFLTMQGTPEAELRPRPTCLVPAECP